MSDFFKSALEYFSEPIGSATAAITATTAVSDNSFVGEIVDVASVKLQISRVIAEGGFGVVYVAQDLSSGKELAVKRLLAADNEAKENVINEIQILKQLSGHPNIIHYLCATHIDSKQTTHGQHEFLIVTEFCAGGSLIDILKNCTTAFENDVITAIFYQACKAVAHMHMQTPAIIHRDIKIENFLLANGIIKLCDFGSATVEVYEPDISWNANKRNTLEEKVCV
jgi:cyclin G-associated kinase